MDSALALAVDSALVEDDLLVVELFGKEMFDNSYFDVASCPDLSSCLKTGLLFAGPVAANGLPVQQMHHLVSAAPSSAANHLCTLLPLQDNAG